MNKEVVVDIDGVLADFEGQFVKVFGAERRELESLEGRYPKQAREIDRYVNDPFIYRNLQPIPLGLELVDFLDSNGFYVKIVSSRPPETQYMTLKWLKKHGIKFFTLGMYPNKTPMIVSFQPLCAVDDLISVSRLLKRYSVPCLLMKHEWNKYYEDKETLFSTISQFVSAFSKIMTTQDKK